MGDVYTLWLQVAVVLAVLAVSASATDYYQHVIEKRGLSSYGGGDFSGGDYGGGDEGGFGGGHHEEFKIVKIPVPKAVPVPVQHPVPIPVPQPYPVHIKVTLPFNIINLDFKRKIQT